MQNIYSIKPQTRFGEDNYKQKCRFSKFRKKLITF